MANFLTRILPRLLTRGEGQLVTRAVEGEYRPGPYYLPVTGGWLPANAPWNFWQSGIDPAGGASSAMVEACLSAYAQTVAMCPGDHWRANDKGGRDRVVNSALSRILRHPNSYQSWSDFMLNLTRSLYADGNAYGLALRNNRFEISELHLMDPRLSGPQVAVTGDVFYHLTGNDVIDRQVEERLLVPQRDVLHVRLHSTRRRYPYPLIGDTPIAAAMQDIAQANAMTAQQIAFYMNQARPSAVLTTDLLLDKDQVQFIRDRWDEQAKGLNQGGTPILTAGLKPHMLSVPSKDAELAEIMKLTDQKIALAFRVPLQILGIGGTTFGSTELLMQSWIASGLGFALNHIEEAFGLLFNLAGQPDEYVEFSTSALLRSAFRERIEGLARAVQGGIFSPNEARNEEGLDDVKFGDEPRVQQQVVPLSAASAIPAAPPAPGAPPQPGSAGGEKEAPAEKPPEESSAKDYNDVVARHVTAILAAASRHERSGA